MKNLIKVSLVFSFVLLLVLSNSASACELSYPTFGGKNYISFEGFHLGNPYGERKTYLNSMLCKDSSVKMSLMMFPDKFSNRRFVFKTVTTQVEGEVLAGILVGETDGAWSNQIVKLPNPGTYFFKLIKMDQRRFFLQAVLPDIGSHTDILLLDANENGW